MKTQKEDSIDWGKREKKYPSVPLIYDLSLMSLEQAYKRFDMVHDKSSRMLTSCSAITIGYFSILQKYLTLGMSNNIEYVSAYVLVCFVISAVLFIWSSQAGHVIISSPENLFEQRSSDTEFEFKYRMIQIHMENYGAVRRDIEMKNRIYTISLCVMLMQLFGIIYCYLFF